MLITAGDMQQFNMMTASWGGMGVLWGKPTATVFIRPERYTKGFIDRTGRFTLSFFPEDMKKALGVMGKESGRTFDKMHYAGLDARELPSGNVSFKQARLVLDCEVKYVDRLDPKKLLDHDVEKWYDGPLYKGGWHDMYIAEIKHAYIAD